MRDQSTYPKEQEKPSSADAPTKTAVIGITELTDEQLDWVTGGGKTRAAVQPLDYIKVTMEDIIITSV
jgi:hypothetical protein